VFTHNILLLTLPICTLAIPLSPAHYAMVSFMPWWIAESTLPKNREWATATLVVWGIGVFLNNLVQSRRGLSLESDESKESSGSAHQSNS
jgi:hypothetical protein